MKILFVSYKFHPDIGGIEVNSEILASHFVDFGAEVHLITTTVEDDDKDFPFVLIRNPRSSVLLQEFAWADVVFENNPTLNLSWPLLFFKKTHVVAIRTWISRMDGTLSLIDKLKKQWVKSANAVIAVSEKIRENTCNKAIVIGNPYRSNLFKRIPDIQKNKDFVFLGRLVSDKGVDMAIEVIHLLHRDYSKKYTLTIVGDGTEMDKLSKLVNQYDLNDYVSFTGTLRGDELVRCLNNHKYMLAPSRWREPFGNIALEGMACGCLPIVSDGGGLIDAVGDAGIVFERNNINSLFSEINKLLKSPALEKKIRNNAANHLMKHQPEIVAKQYYDIIQTVFAK